VAANGRVSVRLSPAQRDLFTRSSRLARDLSHALRQAPVREGKLSVRVRRTELESMIAAAADASPEDRREQRELASLLRYLEDLEDRFDEVGEHEEDTAGARGGSGDHEEHRRAGMSED
jgi:hypothetical protein